MTITVHFRYTGKNGNARKYDKEMISSGTVAATPDIISIRG